MKNLKRVLICGAPDLNYIDGSSIWAQTITLATAATGIAAVDFVAKSTPERDELFGPLKSAPNISIIDGTSRQFWQGKSYKRLTASLMADLITQLDRKNFYDVIIVRGLDIATQLLTSPSVLGKCWMYLTDIPQKITEYTASQRLTMKRIASGCHSLLCQSEGFKSLWEELAPNLGDKKYRFYTPVIPDISTNITPLNERPLQAIYAGKFKGDWMTLEMAELWPKIKALTPSSKLLMLGDKFHDDPQRPDYQERMKSVLEGTAGLTWLGAQTRESVQEHLCKARVGLSWRSESMNDTVEYSTKILEYGGAGCAAILNRNHLHEKLLGQDYPLFANNEEEFVLQLSRALNEHDVTAEAAKRLHNVAKRHTFSSRCAELHQWLTEMPGNSNKAKKTRVLVAGHDLKFFTFLQQKLESTGKFEFLTDQWMGHDRHDPIKSQSLLSEADIIFCEWCLGNIKWYSNHKKPHQRLIARFHAQEARLPYMADANWQAIDHIAFVSEHTRRNALVTFSGFPASKTSVIPNLLDSNKFTTKKKLGDASYTLGILGVAPKSKRLDRAIDLLEQLLEEDHRYCLRVKGKNPLEYNWLLKREDELAYYKQIFERINSNPKLRHSVVFDPAGDDVNDWFTMVGFILSPSDFESYHMAVGEGILTGAIPIIWNWEGASEIWGSNWIVHTVAEAKQAILDGKWQNNLASEKAQMMCSQSSSDSWEKLILMS